MVTIRRVGSKTNLTNRLFLRGVPQGSLVSPNTIYNIYSRPTESNKIVLNPQKSSTLILGTKSRIELMLDAAVKIKLES